MRVMSLKTSGLGLIPGKVIHLSNNSINGEALKIPHIGWSKLISPQGELDWRNKLLQEIKQEEFVYFVHSYMAKPTNNEHLIAETIYGGNLISAVIANENVIGCQFHPEKSGEVGLKILRNFIST